MKNAISTDENHLPMPLRQDITPDMVRDKAREIGPQTFEVIRRMFDEAKRIHDNKSCNNGICC